MARGGEHLLVKEGKPAAVILEEQNLVVDAAVKREGDAIKAGDLAMVGAGEIAMLVDVRKSPSRTESWAKKNQSRSPMQCRRVMSHCGRLVI